MVAVGIAILVLVVGLLAEVLHARRVATVARLAFGPAARPRGWARLAPVARALGLAGLAWGLVTLLVIPPQDHQAPALDKNQLRHLVLVLDVSPSMRLVDAGPTNKQSRLARVADLLESFFARAPEPFRVTVVAVYNGAKPVVVDTLDQEVIRNILNELPMHYAFEKGETRLFDGLTTAAELAHGWNPRSASLMMLTDGDTVPATGMPRLPVAISQVLVVGVGDPRVGKAIDGRNSRQDVSTLRQIATRLGGEYHDGNRKQIGTPSLLQMAQFVEPSPWKRLSLREYALAACAWGASVLALLPVALSRWGTAWRPGVRHQPDRTPLVGQSSAPRTAPRQLSLHA